MSKSSPVSCLLLFMHIANHDDNDDDDDDDDDDDVFIIFLIYLYQFLCTDCV
jgi:hypothetical protein